MPTEMLYRIVDEPDDSPVGDYAVKPFWPWLALAMGGTWLGAPWFIFNAIALGSPTRRREIAIAVLLPLIQVAALALGIGIALSMGYSGSKLQSILGYVRLPLLLVKMVAGYLLFIWQSRAAQLHEHFGRELRNGMFIVIGGAFVADKLLAGLPTWLSVALQ